MGNDIENNIQRHLTTKEGLSTGKITNVHQGPDGYIWISTAHGLNRYDGNEILRINDIKLPFDISYLDHVTTVADQLVINDVNIGLYLFNPKTFKATLLYDEKKSGDTIIHLYSHDESLLVVRENVIALHTIPDNAEHSSSSITFSVPTEGFKIRAAIKVGTLIMCATDRGLRILDLSAGRWLSTSDPLNLKLSDNLKYIVATSNTSLILASEHTLFDIDLKNPLQPVLLEAISLHPISINFINYFDNILLLSTNEGLWSFDPVTSKSKPLLNLSKILPNSRQDILGHYIDRNSNIWFWGDNVGLFSNELFNPEFSNYYYMPQNKHSLPHPNVWGIAPAKDSEVKYWITTSDGMCLLDTESGYIERYPITSNRKTLDGIDGYNTLFNVIYESDTHLWIDSPSLLLYYNKLTRALDNFPETKNRQIFKNQIGFFKGASDKLWATDGNKLHYIDVNTFEYTDVTEQLKLSIKEPISAILGFVFNDERLIFSTLSSLFSFNIKSQQNELLFTVNTDISPTRYNFFESLVIDQNRNIVWLTHLSEGLIALDADTFEQIPQHSTVNQGINAAYRLMLDDAGYLWFSSHKSIIRYTPETQHFLKFSQQDGIGSTEFNALAGIKTAEQKFMYGGTNGVTLFKPEPLLLDKLPTAPSVNISKITLKNNEVIHVDNGIENHNISLDHNQNTAKILLTDNQFHIGNKSNFKYQIRHNRSTTEKQTDNNIIELTQLAYGKSIVEIQAISPITGQASKSKRITFTIIPPFWKSNLAYFIYLVIILGLARFAWKLSKRNLIISYSELTEKEQRFRLALSGSNSEVWEWRHDTECVNGLRIKNIKPRSEKEGSLSHAEYMEKIHPEDREGYQVAWAKLVESRESNVLFKATYRIQHNDGSWVWYKDLGNFVPQDQDSTETRITGTYSDITEVQTNQIKLQRYGEVLQCSLDWVLLVNHDLSEGQANQALCLAFNIDLGQQTVTLSTIFTDPEKLSFYQKIMLNMGQDSHWKGEDSLYCADKHRYHLLINISCQGHGSQRGYIMIMSDITELKKAEQELRSLALEDQLTGLPNRRSFLQELSSSLTTAKNNQQQLAIGFIDLNGFKKINDSFGHTIGDKLLQTTAQRLKQGLPEDAIISRIGGDEFSLIITGQDSIETLEVLLNNVADGIQQPMTLTQHTVTIGSSIGVSIYPQHGNNEDELIHHADLAMYLAKTTKEPSFLLYNHDMVSPIHQQLALEKKLTFAFENKQFLGYYQPIVDTETQQIRGLELLLRWTPDNKIESIGHYATIAEDMGILSQITQQILDTALIKFKQWLDINPALFLSINISTEHIKQADLSNVLISKISQHSIPANKICLEISEKSTSSDLEQSNNNLAKVNQSGMLIGIDDFGIQAASFSRLRELDIDLVKIDMSFIQGIHCNKVDEVIICKIVEIAEQLGISCIAEGIETEEQRQYLQSIGCQLSQGYLFSHALPAEEITTLLLRSQD